MKLNFSLCFFDNLSKGQKKTTFKIAKFSWLFKKVNSEQKFVIFGHDVL